MITSNFMSVAMMSINFGATFARDESLWVTIVSSAIKNDACRPVVGESHKESIQEDVEMLIISRKRYQTIHIGDNVVIKVLKTGKSTVKIGIDAPRHVRVLR